MAGVRDPAFWRRFSMAVHLDEEAQNGKKVNELKHSDSWLAREQQKKSRRTCICWGFWISCIAVIAGVVIVILWLKSSGVLDHIGSSGSSASATSTASATATAAATSTSTSKAAATSTLAAKRS